MRFMRRIVAALAVAGVLGIGVGTAAAEELWIIARAYSVVMRTLTFHADGTGETVACPVTLEGSFSVVTFAPVARTRIGTVGRARLGTCTGGSATVLSETLPWTLQYDSFGGTLPQITSMTTRIVGASFRTSMSGVTCLARSEETEPLKLRFGRETPGELPEASLVETSRIRLTGALCELFGRGYLTGSGTDRKPELEEGEPELYLNALGNALVAAGQGSLVTVNIPGPAGTTATLRVANRLREDIRVIEAPRSGDTSKFTIVAAGTECGGVVTTLDRNQGNNCAIQIRRENGAAVNDVVPITIRYWIDLTAPRPITQTFNVRAT